MAKVVFCQRVVFSYFGVMTMSAVLKRDGHQTDLIMEADPSKVIQEAVALNPDMMMFSTVTATGDFEWALDIARELKKQKPSMLMVFGSTHPTLFPEETMSNLAVDIACRGEGELAVLELCQKFDRKEDYSRISNLCVRTAQGVIQNPMGNLVEDLDQFPYPDRELYQKYGYFNNLHSIDVLAGRGCNFNCSYCMNTTTKEMMRGQGKFVRKHSVDYMMTQFKEIIKKYNVKSLTFQDELFTANKRWVKDFCERYGKEIQLPFTCSATADTIDDDIALWLKEAGVFRVCFGLETGNEDLRNNLLNKHFTNAQVIESASILHKHGIKFLTLNMIGLPGETVEQAFETMDLNRIIQADFLYFSIFQPYPKLPITKQLEREGRIDELKPADYSTTFFKDSLIKQDNIDELVNLHKFFFPVIKWPWTKKIVRQLIKLPPNWFFEQVFIISFGWTQLTCYKRSFLQLLIMGVGNVKIFYEKKQKDRLLPRSKGVLIFGVLLIVSSIIHIQKLVEASGTYYVQYFGFMPEWLLLARYMFSWFQRAIGILIALGLLAQKEVARKAGILLGIFTVLTLYWKHPYEALKEHTKHLDALYGKILLTMGIKNITFSSVTFPSLIGLYLADIIFWAIFIYFFTRPSVKAQFKPRDK